MYPVMKNLFLNGEPSISEQGLPLEAVGNVETEALQVFILYESGILCEIIYKWPKQPIMEKLN